MNHNKVSELAKYTRFFTYLALMVVVIVLALFLFRYSNTIYTTLSRSPEFINVETDFYYLFIFMILLLIIPFTAFFILAVIELSNLMGQLRSSILDKKTGRSI